MMNFYFNTLQTGDADLCF